MKKIVGYLILFTIFFANYSRRDPEYKTEYRIIISIFGMGLCFGMLIKIAEDIYKNRKKQSDQL